MLSSSASVFSQQYDVRYKVVLVGESTVGKTSLLRCWRGDPFEPSLMSTVGLDFAARMYDLPEGRLRLDVWDTAGQERYGSITSVHYRDAKAFVFVYSVCDAHSFRQLARRWLNTVDEHISDAVPIFIVGNKSDLEAQREVSTVEGQRFADGQGAMSFFETSAKKGSGVLELFSCVATNLTAAWGILKIRCVDQEDYDAPKTLQVCDKCSKCGHTHKKRGIRIRSFSGRSKQKNCCAAKELRRRNS